MKNTLEEALANAELEETLRSLANKLREQYTDEELEYMAERLLTDKELQKQINDEFYKKIAENLSEEERAELIGEENDTAFIHVISPEAAMYRNGFLFNEHIVDPENLAMAILENEGNENWPSWCFCPISKIQKFHKESLEEIDTISDPHLYYEKQLMRIIMPWRHQKGILKFNAKTFDKVIIGPYPQGKLKKILYLPQWCVYIPTPGFTYLGAKMYGFFASWNFSLRLSDCPELEIGIHSDDNLLFLFSISTFDFDKDLNDVVDINKFVVFPPVIKSMREFIKDHNGTQFPETEEGDQALSAQHLKDLENIIKLLSYVCSKKAKITSVSAPGQKPSRTYKIKRNKGLPFIQNPAKVTVWDVK